jgi:hypothetical protein
MNKIKKYLVRIIVLFLIASFPSYCAGTALAEEDCASLQVKDICRVQLDGQTKIQVEFTLTNTPGGVVNHGEVNYSITLPTGETLNRTAGFTQQLGSTSHYVDILDDPGPGPYTLNWAFLWVNGIKYILQNPGVISQCKPPTNVVLSSFAGSTGSDGLSAEVFIPIFVFVLVVAIGYFLFNLGWRPKNR